MSTQSRANPEVDAWFQKLDHPQKLAMMAVRAAILDADPRISESIKWSTPTFHFNGNLASLQPKARRFVSLLFHRGSEIPGDHPYLQGDAALARTIRFADEGEVEERRSDLQAVVRDWCDMKDDGRSPAT